MMTTIPLSLDVLRPQFEALLRAAGTSISAPELPAAWNAFAAFSQLSVACDDEGLFFECGISPSDENCYYVHFTRTFFGRDAGNHFWSHEVNCDFLFACDQTLASIAETVEIEELAVQPDERATFFRDVNAISALWNALKGRQSLDSTIYIGES